MEVRKTGGQAVGVMRAEPPNAVGGRFTFSTAHCPLPTLSYSTVTLLARLRG